MTRRSRPPMYRGKSISRSMKARPLHWKKKKLLTILANRRQWMEEFPTYSTPLELVTEAGEFFLTETSSTSEPFLEYLATE